MPSTTSEPKKEATKTPNAVRPYSEFYRAATSTLITAKGLILGNSGNSNSSQQNRFVPPPAPAPEVTTSIAVVENGNGNGTTTTVPAPIADTILALDASPMQGRPNRVDGKPTDEDLLAINKMSKSGNVDPASVYVFDAAISNQRVDSYFTRMDISSLQYYVQDASNGVPVMNSHHTGGYASQTELPIGRSFWGGLDSDPQLAGSSRAVSSAYMLRSNQANGSVNTADIIAGIEAGINSDVSIGFYFSPGTPQNNFQDRTWLSCSICGRDFLATDWWDDKPDTCKHWPGEMYDGQLCYLNVMNARLSEFSPVYAGACEGAVILKAERAASAGTLSRSQMRLLGDNYGVRLSSRGAVVSKSAATVTTKSRNLPLLVPHRVSSSSNGGNNNIEKGDNTVPIQEQQKEPNPIAGNVDAVVVKGFLTERLRKTVDGFTRDMSDDEKEMAQNAIDCMASGDMDTAMQHLSKLMESSTTTTPANSNGALDQGEINDGQMMAAGDDSSSEMALSAAADDQVLEPGGGAEDQNGDNNVDASAADDDGGSGEDATHNPALDAMGNPVDVDSPENTKADLMMDGEDGGSEEEDDEEDDENKWQGGDRAVRYHYEYEKDVLPLQRSLKASQTEIAGLNRRLQELEPLARYGQECFDTLVSETVLQATRAQIAGVDETSVRDMCQRMTPAQIQTLCNTYKASADARLGNVDQRGNPTSQGGRQTVPLAPNTPINQWQAAAAGQRNYLMQTGLGESHQEIPVWPGKDLGSYR